MKYFYLQYRAPEGNWYNGIGSSDLESLWPSYLATKVRKIAARIIVRNDSELCTYLPENEDEENPDATN